MSAIGSKGMMNQTCSISDNLSDRVVKVISSWFVYIGRLGQNLLKIPFTIWLFKINAPVLN